MLWREMPQWNQHSDRMTPKPRVLDFAYSLRLNSSRLKEALLYSWEELESAIVSATTARTIFALFAFGTLENKLSVFSIVETARDCS